MTTEAETTGDANALACATLVDEWIGLGLRHAVVSPGSRSTPLALAVAARTELSVHVVHDERSAAFVALGLGLDGVPAALICTSGTAAANYHPAVAEAGLSDVPMLVLTADRPPELRDVGAPQTIDQIGLFTVSVRTMIDAPVPGDTAAGEWRPLARAVFDAASGRGQSARPGPAHLNLPFREPLLGTVAELPPPLPEPAEPAPSLAADVARSSDVDAVAAALRTRRGAVVCGGRADVGPNLVIDVARRLGWPVLADPTSGVRGQPGVVTTFDSLLRVPAFADAHLPDVVLRFGRAPASKVLSQWTARTAVVQVGGPGVINPEHNVIEFTDIATVVAAVDTLTIDEPTVDDAKLPDDGRNDDWYQEWSEANEAAEGAIVATLSGYGQTLTEPGVARLVAQLAASIDDAELVVSSSMPIRDIEWYGGPHANVHANRGANGIDGVTSTAIGRALSGRTTFELIGDIAFVHDSSALVALATRDVDLRIVVIDNGGGGIFSFLPQHDELSTERFEQLFGTPHGTDIVTLGAAHQLPAITVSTLDELGQALERGGPRIVRVVTDRTANLEVHRALNAAVAQALS